MADNLDIDLDQFTRMRSIDRDTIIYKNLVHLRGKTGDYKFHKKIQYVWLVCLTILLGGKRFLGL